MGIIVTREEFFGKHINTIYAEDSAYFSQVFGDSVEITEENFLPHPNLVQCAAFISLQHGRDAASHYSRMFAAWLADYATKHNSALQEIWTVITGKISVHSNVILYMHINALYKEQEWVRAKLHKTGRGNLFPRVCAMFKQLDDEARVMNVRFFVKVMNEGCQ